MAAAATGTYGGTTTATATLTCSGCPIANETVSFSLNGVSEGIATTNASGVATLSAISLADCNAGTYTSCLAASFAGDANYGSSTANATLVINPAPLTVTGITANNKAYDSTTTASLNTASASLVGVEESDSLTLNTAGATGMFASPNVANGIAVTVSGLTVSGTAWNRG